MDPIVTLHKGTALLCEDLTFGWGEDVIHHVSFSVGEGELVTITGPAGSGKSTLLRLLSTLEEDFKGKISLGEKSLRTFTREEIKQWRKKQGTLLSPPGLFDWMTAGESLNFILAENGETISKWAERSERAIAVLGTVGLAEGRNLYPREMSGGMQKRLAIARALVLDPSLLLLDDPTAGLDPVTGHALVDLIGSLKQDRTIVLATSDIALVKGLADRVCFLVEGRLQFFGTATEFQNVADPYVRQFLTASPEGPIG